MVDNLLTEERSSLMSHVKSRGNLSTEKTLIRVFRENRISGWRRNLALYGRPDFAFPRHRVLVFVDGCFWHGCPIHCRVPASHTDYWKEKIARNSVRDRTTNQVLRNRGWQVLRVWEHELTSRNRTKLLRKLARLLPSPPLNPRPCA